MATNKDKEIAASIILGFLTLIAIIYWFILFTIRLARFFYWVSIGGLVVSTILTLYFWH